MEKKKNNKEIIECGQGIVERGEEFTLLVSQNKIEEDPDAHFCARYLGMSDDSHFVLGISDYDGSFPVFYSLDSSCKIFLLGKYYYVMAFNPEKIILKLADEQ